MQKPPVCRRRTAYSYNYCCTAVILVQLILYCCIGPEYRTTSGTFYSYGNKLKMELFAAGIRVALIKLDATSAVLSRHDLLYAPVAEYEQLRIYFLFLALHSRLLAKRAALPRLLLHTAERHSSPACVAPSSNIDICWCGSAPAVDCCCRYHSNSTTAVDVVVVDSHISSPGE